MEPKAEDTLARAFDEDAFNPYSEPLEAARYLIRKLKEDGFEVERADKRSAPDV